MIIVKYAFFAVISTLFNLGFQYLSLHIYNGVASLYMAMSSGTLAGLVIKYLMDKKWIFYHTTNNKKDDAKKFILYSCVGGVTTAIFWGTEVVFHYLFVNPSSKYVGAILGLMVGYVLKYFLDKKYVFTQNKEVLL